MMSWWRRAWRARWSTACNGCARRRACRQQTRVGGARAAPRCWVLSFARPAANAAHVPACSSAPCVPPTSLMRVQGRPPALAARSSGRTRAPPCCLQSLCTLTSSRRQRGRPTWRRRWPARKSMCAAPWACPSSRPASSQPTRPSLAARSTALEGTRARQNLRWYSRGQAAAAAEGQQRWRQRRCSKRSSEHRPCRTSPHSSWGRCRGRCFLDLMPHCCNLGLHRLVSGVSDEERSGPVSRCVDRTRATPAGMRGRAEKRCHSTAQRARSVHVKFAAVEA